jgi:hypothetical protein
MEEDLLCKYRILQPVLFYHFLQHCSRAILGKNSNAAENLALTRVDIIIREWIANRKYGFQVI